MTIALIVIAYWQWKLGITFDNNNNRIKICFNLCAKDIIERNLSDVKEIRIERNKNIGFDFTIVYFEGYSEKIFYKFYRISWVESIQYKRLKKKINKYFEQNK